MDKNINGMGFERVLSKYTAIMIFGCILFGVSFIGLVYSGSLVIKDETGGNVGGPSSLPKTHIGPLSMYHVEYGFVFLLIVGFAALFWGWWGRHEQKSQTSSSIQN